MDGSPLPGKTKSSKSQAALEIPNFQQEDEGVYECVAGNLRGSNLAKGHLIFYGELTGFRRALSSTQTAKVIASRGNVPWEREGTSLSAEDA